MKTKDIEIGKFYSMKIWDDEEAIYFECIGYDGECFEMQECPWYGYDYETNPDEVYPWLIRDDDEMDCLKEIHPMQYMIRSIGLLVEKNIMEAVEEEKKNHPNLPTE